MQIGAPPVAFTALFARRFLVGEMIPSVPVRRTAKILAHFYRLAFQQRIVQPMNCCNGGFGGHDFRQAMVFNRIVFFIGDAEYFAPLDGAVGWKREENPSWFQASSDKFFQFSTVRSVIDSPNENPHWYPLFLKIPETVTF